MIIPSFKKNKRTQSKARIGMYLTGTSANKMVTLQLYITIPGLIYLRVQLTGCFAICGSPGTSTEALDSELAICQKSCEHQQLPVQKSSVIWEQSRNSTQNVNGRYFHVSFKVLATYLLLHQPFLSLPTHFLSEIACLKHSSWPHHGHILNGARLLRTAAALGVTPDFYPRCPT